MKNIVLKEILVGSSMTFLCYSRTGFSALISTASNPFRHIRRGPFPASSASSLSFSSSPLRVASYSSTTMPKPAKSQTSPPTVRPSSSVVLLSPTNQVLLLKRVQTSSSFASAHVFPGGNLSKFHDGDLGDPANLDVYHRDNEHYRLAAVRETFEETGILLAFQKDKDEVLVLPEGVREQGRLDVHANRKGFKSWLEEVGGRVDLDGLIPFTRWITPPNMKKRFTTQMYVYMMPLSSTAIEKGESKTTVVVPTHDGGLEHTELAFNDIKDWLEQAKRGAVTLYPPQFYIMSVLEPFFEAGAGTTEEQRRKFLEFVAKVPTGGGDKETEMIPWGEKVMSPTVVGKKEDGRLVMVVDKPGLELEGTGRGGDGSRAVIVRFGKDGPSEVSVEPRDGGKDVRGKL